MDITDTIDEVVHDTVRFRRPTASTNRMYCDYDRLFNWWHEYNNNEVKIVQPKWIAIHDYNEEIKSEVDNMDEDVVRFVNSEIGATTVKIDELNNRVNHNIHMLSSKTDLLSDKVHSYAGIIKALEAMHVEIAEIKDTVKNELKSFSDELKLSEERLARLEELFV